jgi:excinuclease ABC subunit A
MKTKVVKRVGKTDEKVAENCISIRGARVHNLKNIDVDIPRNQMVVITGLSGSGKSSLAFDTLFAEGQRRYVESLSSYARQFLDRLDKPDVDSITGISPAIAIEQKVTSRTSRSTVGTNTEIYDYLKLLFARIGKTYSPVSGKEVTRHKTSDVLDFIQTLKEETRILVLSPIEADKKQNILQKIESLGQQGFTRIRIDKEIVLIEELPKSVDKKARIELLVDRASTSREEDNLNRLADSVESAFFEGQGTCIIEEYDSGKRQVFSNKFEADGISFEIPDVNFFTFNNPVGACKRCEGFGSIIGIDENLVVPDQRLSIYQDAVVCWKGEKMSEWKKDLIRKAAKFDFPVHKPYRDLSAKQKAELWGGNQYFVGIDAFFKFVESESYKIQYRVMLSRYRGKTKCPDCAGTRLRKDASYVKINGKSIQELVTMPVKECMPFFENLKLSKPEQEISHRILTEIKNRLQYLSDVGLNYLTLNRLSSSLSGGESQRINLATTLGSSLVGSMYILDEPSIGLHPRDTDRLIKVLKGLQEQGNSVIIVEHDEEIMRSSDHIIDMGPEAGSLGGKVVFTGSPETLVKSGKTLTSDYLNGTKHVHTLSKRKVSKDKLIIRGAREHNLKNIDVEIPLRSFTVISGVSGSGKSTLVKNILYPALMRERGEFTAEQSGLFDALEGDVKTIQAVEWVDQNPIGKSSRSNPVTYVKAFDEIRNLYSSMPLAKQRLYKPGHFSFNTEGGRCEHCEGEGYQTIEMQFMADIRLLCDACKGKRFKEEVLEINYREKNISDILNMTVDDAIAFFRSGDNSTNLKNLLQKLEPLQDVGLGYITLGQSSSSLSGGEAQRIKLASFLGKGSSQGHTLFIFDEPTTGLHFHDVNKLMSSFDALLSKGHSILAIEHNPDVIRAADWLIDLGPEGGDEGGELLYAGIPEKIASVKRSYTGKFVFGK